MEIKTITPELLTKQVMDQIVNDLTTAAPTPKQASTTMAFALTSFYDHYGKYWDWFLDLRKEVSIAMANPEGVRLEDYTTVFNVASNHIHADSLAILKVYLTHLGWKNIEVNQTGFVKFRDQFGITSKDTYQFRLSV